MAVVEDVVAWPILKDLLQELRLEIVRSGLPPLGLAIVAPGAEASYDVGCEPLGFVRATSVYPSTAFPAAEGGPLGSCVSSLAVSVQVGVMRCAPLPQNVNGQVSFPTEDDLTEAARIQLADMAAIRRAILQVDVEDRVLGSYIPQNSADLVGGYWLATLGR